LRRVHRGGEQGFCADRGSISRDDCLNAIVGEQGHAVGVGGNGIAGASARVASDLCPLGRPAGELADVPLLLRKRRPCWAL
jgi:hypothetical protein